MFMGSAGRLLGHRSYYCGAIWETPGTSDTISQSAAIEAQLPRGLHGNEGKQCA